MACGLNSVFPALAGGFIAAVPPGPLLSALNEGMAKFEVVGYCSLTLHP